MTRCFVVLVFLGACESSHPVPVAPHTAEGTLAACRSTKHSNLAMMMGASTDSTAQFNILLPKAATVSARVLSGAEIVAPSLPPRVLLDDSQPCKIVRIRFDRLAPATEYTLDVTVSGAGAHKESRHFRTQDPTAERFRLAFGTCMNDEPAYHAAQRHLYQALTDQRPDLLVIGGDTVYVDAWAFWPDGYVPGKNVFASDIWRRYTESWLTLDLYHQDPLTPVIATWDDHDYGQNDGDRTFVLKAASTHAFEAFFGSEDVIGTHFSFVNSPAAPAASSYRAGDELFVLLDNRSERVSEGKADYDHFGAAQEAWLDQVIAGVPRVWLVSGNQFRGDHHMKGSLSRDSATTFARLMERIEARPSGSLVLLGGDTHVSEVQVYPTPNGSEVTEFTISPLHSRITDKHVALNNPERPNPFRLRHESGVDLGAMQPNVGLFDIEAGAGAYDFTMIGEGGTAILSPVRFAAPD